MRARRAIHKPFALPKALDMSGSPSPGSGEALSKGGSTKAVRVLVFYAAVILVWYGVTAAKVWSPYLLPSPMKVFDTMVENTRSGLILESLAISLRRLLVGYVLAVAMGISLGLLIGSAKWADETVGSAVLGLLALPSIAWLPLAVLWFGLNENAIIFVVLLGSVFSIAVSTRSGVHNLPVLQRNAARTLGATRYQMYRYVVLPGMLPSLVQGLKLGWSFAWRSLMSAELLVVGLGLGQLLNVGRDLNNMSLVIAVMAVIIAVGLLFDRLLFARVERCVNERWGLAKA